ncbi:MAG: hypothetical protein ABIY70_24775 [Capsulimonas sp.]|uniref:hypothetical protein n=1 Tax=Capsulimonas sp. TaxID=2494211 RepID=UPI0032671A90
MAVNHNMNHLTVITIDNVDQTISPRHLDNAKAWGWVAATCILTTVVLSFLPTGWARAGGIALSMMAMLSIFAAIDQFSDYAWGIQNALDDLNEEDAS